MMKVYEVIKKLIYFGALKHVAILLVYLSLNTAQKCQYAHFLVQSAIIPPLPPPISVMSHLHHQTHPPSLTSSNYTLPVVFFPPPPCFPPSGGCQGPAGGRAAGSGAQPGPVWRHGPTEARRDQGADPPRNPQRAEDQRRCWKPAKGKKHKLFISS